MRYPKEFYDQMRPKNLEGNFPEGIACGCKYRVTTVKDTKRFFVLVDVQGQDAELVAMNNGEMIKAKLSELDFVNRKDNKEQYERLTKPVSVRDIKKHPNRHVALLWGDLVDFTANNTLEDSINYFHLYCREISDAIITAAHGISREIKDKKLRRKVLDVINCNISLHDPKA
jgi:hypothetical protein